VPELRCAQILQGNRDLTLPIQYRRNKRSSQVEQDAIRGIRHAPDQHPATVPGKRGYRSNGFDARLAGPKGGIDCGRRCSAGSHLAGHRFHLLDSSYLKAFLLHSPPSIYHFLSQVSGLGLDDVPQRYPVHVVYRFEYRRLFQITMILLNES
jgi:hypothetical protein